MLALGWGCGEESVDQVEPRGQAETAGAVGITRLLRVSPGVRLLPTLISLGRTLP